MQVGALPKLWLAPRLGLGFEVWASRLWSAGLGASATLPGSRDVTVEESRATIGLATARLEACASVRPRAHATFVGCGLFTGGRIEGSSTSSSVTRREKWLTPGILARAESRTFKPLWLFAEASVGWPLVRSGFFFSRATAPTSVRAYQVPAQVFSADIGLLLRFE
jgi:hypothetical protein